jgi:hypothetical protein
VPLLVIIACVGGEQDIASNRAAGEPASVPQVDSSVLTRPQPEPRAESPPAEMTAEVMQSVRECVAHGSEPTYTQREHDIYQELMDTPMSVSEAEAAARIGRKYNLNADEVLAISKKVMMAVYTTTPPSSTKTEVECVVSKFASIHTVIVSGDFANVGYIERFNAVDDDEVRLASIVRMPMMLEALFMIPTIQRIRLTAYYPAIDDRGSSAGVKRVGGLEASRADFAKGKRAQGYTEFWVTGN